jgi:hypothetical protein
MKEAQLTDSRAFPGENDMMANRMPEVRRVLKPTGSL